MIYEREYCTAVRRDRPLDLMQSDSFVHVWHVMWHIMIWVSRGVPGGGKTADSPAAAGAVEEQENVSEQLGSVTAVTLLTQAQAWARWAHSSDLAKVVSDDGGVTSDAKGGSTRGWGMDHQAGGQ
jgi:hypothetical protein